MNRWLHALFAVAALAVVISLVVFWPTPQGPGPQPQPTPPPSGLPPPTGPVPTGPAPTDPGSTPPCPDRAPARLRVVTFNIHGGVGPGDRYDLAGIAREIDSWDPDVVLLQEVHRFRAKSGLDDQPAELSRMLGMQVVFGHNDTKAPEAAGAPRRHSGTAILSREPILSWSNQMLPNQPGLQQRGLLRATIQVGGRAVDVLNTHLQHTRGNIRIVQTHAIRRLVGRLGHPFLLGGDFNAEPGSPAMRVLNGVVTDPWPQVGVGDGLTVPPRVPRRRIDFVLYGSGGWVPEQAQVVKSAIADHRAVLLDYALPPLAC